MNQMNGACNFFMWYDPPMSSHARSVIVGVLRRIEKDEIEYKRRIMQGKWIWVKAVGLVFIGFVFGRICS